MAQGWVVWFLSLVAGALFTSALAQSDQVINAFTIAKETSESSVYYDAKLTDDCHFVDKDPIEMHWGTPSKSGKLETEKLNFIQRAIYGLEIHESRRDLIVGEIKALRRKNLTMPLRITVLRKKSSCVVTTFLSGKQLPHEVEINSVYLKNFHGQAPSNMSVRGTDVATGQYTDVTVDFG